VFFKIEEEEKEKKKEDELNILVLSSEVL